MVLALNDKELINLFLQGSEQAFEIFYKKHKDNVFRYVLAMTSNHDTSTEICAAAWEMFINKCHLILDNPSAYLFAIARNELANYYRKNPTTKSSDKESNDIFSISIDTDAEIAMLLKSLNELPESQKEALLLKHLAGFSLNEIAKYQGISHESAKSRVRYAIKKLRTYFSLSGETS